MSKLLNLYPAISDLEKRAQKRIPEVSWAYLQTGTGSEQSLQRNLDKMAEITLLPQFMKGEIKPTVSTNLFGQNYAYPFGIAPVGLTGLMWPKAEIYLAETAHKHWKENWDYLLSAIRGATYYKLPKVFQWLTGNIGFHHLHHLSSLIPNYNLERCYKENRMLNKYVTVVTFKESLGMMFHNLWDEERQKMISFWEYSKMKRMGMV